MTYEARQNCEYMLAELGSILRLQLVQTVPVERVPMLADAVRTYVETQVVYAQATEQATGGATVDPSGE